MAGSRFKSSSFPHRSTDSALTRITTPFPVEWLREFCEDVERLYRINPLLEVMEWRQISDHEYHLRARNLSSDQEISTVVCVEEIDGGVKITYAGRLRWIMLVRVEPDEEGSALILSQDYRGLSAAERKRYLTEEDGSLESWGQELSRFFQYWNNWSWFPPFRWYTHYLWLKMKPRTRRVAYMVVIITLFELVIMLGVVGFFIVKWMWF